ncbi:type II toxin-antitoxin system HicA family toxin [Candidatus Kaiserbacteria bacterium]|nr:type II toxin-antitoxin system HicA family toxin [Candidatus Kaiserbacteria bacterium]
MAKLPVVRTRALVRALLRLGFFKHHQVGSHAQFKHPDGRRTTVYIHEGKDIGKKTLKGIIMDLNMTVDEFIAALKNQK